ncbi:uveal autoantigen with coiled-coil domains and ankyrin repeats-like [Centruroides sculpturatus]|uniref:uveal autoantigen with coiled-coil domains and ankyrin repeats-like n=1 Tax=Centruroides sculpturatus TaxID=218467 RepID=UPI000C6EC0C0|nr:uveal autoantigen with coiled-coil domains and ankyrin repeats-like [Centruroides sculpturatus]
MGNFEFFMKRSGKDYENDSIIINPNAQNDKGRTSLHIETIKGDRQMVLKMLKSGVDINIQDEDGKTALMLAIQWSHEHVANTLLEARPNISISDKENMTALHLLAKTKLIILALKIIKMGANVDAIDNKGRTPLMLACQYKNLDMVSLLLEQNAKIHIKDSMGRSAYEYTSDPEIIFLMKGMVKHRKGAREGSELENVNCELQNIDKDLESDDTIAYNNIVSESENHSYLRLPHHTNNESLQSSTSMHILEVKPSNVSDISGILGKLQQENSVLRRKGSTTASEEKNNHKKNEKSTTKLSQTVEEDENPLKISWHSLIQSTGASNRIKNFDLINGNYSLNTENDEIALKSSCNSLPFKKKYRKVTFDWEKQQHGPFKLINDHKFKTDYSYSKGNLDLSPLDFDESEMIRSNLFSIMAPQSDLENENSKFDKIINSTQLFKADNLRKTIIKVGDNVKKMDKEFNALLIYTKKLLVEKKNLRNIIAEMKTESQDLKNELKEFVEKNKIYYLRSDISETENQVKTLIDVHKNLIDKLENLVEKSEEKCKEYLERKRCLLSETERIKNDNDTVETSIEKLKKYVKHLNNQSTEKFIAKTKKFENLEALSSKFKYDVEERCKEIKEIQQQIEHQKQIIEDIRTKLRAFHQLLKKVQSNIKFINQKSNTFKDIFREINEDFKIAINNFNCFEEQMNDGHRLKFELKNKFEEIDKLINVINEKRAENIEEITKLEKSIQLESERRRKELCEDSMRCINLLLKERITWSKKSRRIIQLLEEMENEDIYSFNLKKEMEEKYPRLREEEEEEEEEDNTEEILKMTHNSIHSDVITGGVLSVIGRGR